LAMSSAALCFPPFVSQVHFTYPVLLAFAAATLWLVSRPMPRALNWAVSLGDSSYSLYLFHPFVAPAAVLLIARLLPDAGAWWHMLIVLFFTILACHVLHLVVEVPIVREARRRLIDTGPLKVPSARAA
jgi:exopolysaccharide production protein ExoZ